ncbi:MAG: hypothetical protein V4530_08795 [Pseudomonadota bacterium]
MRREAAIQNAIPAECPTGADYIPDFIMSGCICFIFMQVLLFIILASVMPWQRFIEAISVFVIFGSVAIGPVVDALCMPPAAVPLDPVIWAVAGTALAAITAAARVNLVVNIMLS